VNSISLNKVTSLLEVAANKSCGKASSDSGLRMNLSISIQLETILNMVTIRNLIRLAGTSLSYRTPHLYVQVATWLKSCVQDFNQEIICTALQKEDYKAQEPKFYRLKNRKNSRTAGFNFCNTGYKGKRSVRSISCMKEGTQVNELFVSYRRSFSTKIRTNNLNERVMATELKQIVEKCKNKDGRYGNIIQIIGSISTIKLAYLMVKSNTVISSKRICNTPLDDISLKTLQKISKDTLSGVIKFSTLRRVVTQKSCKTALHPLGVSNSQEKIVQKAIEIVLTTIFEEIFLDCSHGFRPGRSCHTALKHLQFKIGNSSNYSWVVKGGTKKCFNNIPHKMILKVFKRKVDCPTTINLIKRILNAGYVLNNDLKKVGPKNAKVYKSSRGIPHNIVLRPLFINIVLHELDEFIINELKSECNKDKKQKANLWYPIKRDYDLKKRRILINNCLKISSKGINYLGFDKLFYVRYADDWVVLVAGSMENSKVILNKISDKLQSLGLNLNIEKTPITSLRKSKCRFLGIDFFIRNNTKEHHKPKRLLKNKPTIRQIFAPRIILHAPIIELLVQLKNNGFVTRNSKGEFFPIGKSNCISLTHPQILNYFNSKIRGILNYYSCVHNINELSSIVRFLNYSCALTLARKFKLKSLHKTFKKFGRDLVFENKNGKKYKIFQPNNLRMLLMNERFVV
jgi:RNA-directed DNA polymerase